MTTEFRIASTYKRKVEVDFPGDGLKPQTAEITVELRDLDPDQLQSDEEKIRSMMSALTKLIAGVREGKAIEQVLDPGEEENLAKLEVKPKIDRIVAGIELPDGFTVTRDGEPLTGDALVEFAKKYPRWKKAILKRWSDENEPGGEGAALGNLLGLAGR